MEAEVYKFNAIVNKLGVFLFVASIWLRAAYYVVRGALIY